MNTAQRLFDTMAEQRRVGLGAGDGPRYIQRFRTHAKALRHMRLEGIKVPPDYQARFGEALLTFQHQWVYCPKQVDTFSKPPPTLGEKLTDLFILVTRTRDKLLRLLTCLSCTNTWMVVVHTLVW